MEFTAAPAINFELDWKGQAAPWPRHVQSGKCRVYDGNAGGDARRKAEKRHATEHDAVGAFRLCGIRFLAQPDERSVEVGAQFQHGSVDLAHRCKLVAEAVGFDPQPVELAASGRHDQPEPFAGQGSGVACGHERADDGDAQRLAQRQKARIGRAPWNDGVDVREIARLEVAQDFDARLVALGFRLNAGRAPVIAPQHKFNVRRGVRDEKRPALRHRGFAHGRVRDDDCDFHFNCPLFAGKIVAKAVANHVQAHYREEDGEAGE